MATSSDSIAALFARQFSGAGTPSGDPLLDAMNSVIEIGAQRVAEMKLVGFSTDITFNLNVLTRSFLARQDILLVSNETGTGYRVRIVQPIGHNLQVGVQVYNQGQVHDKFHKMTLMCAGNGNIRVVVGW